MTSAIWPLGLLCAGIIKDLALPPRHSLFVNAIAWLAVAVYQWSKIKDIQGVGDTKRWRIACLAGLLYALAQLCERASAENNRLWWTKALLPGFVYLIPQLVDDLYTPQISTNTPNGAAASTSSNGATIPRKFMFLALGIGVLSLRGTSMAMMTLTLNLSSNVMIAISFWLIQHLLRMPKDEKAAHGTTERPIQQRRLVSMGSRQAEIVNTSMRDISMAIGVSCVIASLSFESFRGDGFTLQRRLAPSAQWDPDWQNRQPAWRADKIAFGIVIEALRAVSFLVVAQQDGALSVSLLVLGSSVLANTVMCAGDYHPWLALLYTALLLVRFDDTHDIPGLRSTSSRIFVRRLLLTLGFTTITIGCLSGLKSGLTWRHEPLIKSLSPFDNPLNASEPLQLTGNSIHPVRVLTRRANVEYKSRVQRQSKSMEEAAAEYWRRYKVAPPPKFDAWYEFAKDRNVQLIDEFDMIYHSLLPFWALSPATIRSRTTEALGNTGNMLMAVFIRNGRIASINGGQKWQQNATLGLLNNFVQHLPDMDLAFNLHDEPRVILPHDLLAQMVTVARDVRIPAAAGRNDRKNMFSSRPADMHNGKRSTDVKHTRFNVHSRQQTWTQSKASCPPDTPARSFEDGPQDNATSYALTDFGFIYNQTAFADICYTPSLRRNFGFFEGPNVYNVVQELFPIFSQSKISSYSDILYPSPWYWYQKVEYDPERDMPFDMKQKKLYWRGSTTGGFSRNGGWKKHHRQRVIRILNEPEVVQLLNNRGHGEDEATADWQVLEANRRQFAPLIDCKFTYVGQCDPGDCDAQREFFDIAEREDRQEAWKYQHLLDMDGNAFSGRFYAFLKSNSVTYKMNLFQEWHRDWIKPWVHYVPFSLKGGEWLEAVRYFTYEKEGVEQAKQIAEQSRDFANTALRNEDFEAWFFRLLLEYGRLIDDDREGIGYNG